MAAPISPHTMGHAYADHIAKHAGVQTAQALLGHADLGTTQAYLGAPTADELQQAVAGISFGALVEHTFYHYAKRPQRQ
jgi:integrase/recombinase XerD